MSSPEGKDDDGIRRSGRKRVSTILKVDGYDVLVKNNYVVKGMAYQTGAYTADVAKKPKKQKTQATNLKKEPTERKQSSSEVARLQHNEAVKASIKEKESYRRDFLVNHQTILEPFMDEPTRRMVQQWSESKPSVPFRQGELCAQPDLVTGGEMRDYQLVGLNFMLNLHKQNIGMILGDEMGLVRLSRFKYKLLQHLLLCRLTIILPGENPSDYLLVVSPKGTQ